MSEEAPQMDWQQVALNGGPPCFAVLDDEEGWYCGRAERWEGHDGEHTFISLNDFMADLVASALEEKEQEIERLKDELLLLGPERDRWEARAKQMSREIANQSTAIEQARQEVEVTELLSDLKAWIVSRLEHVAYRQSETWGPVRNGYTYVEIPEWQMRQKLEALEMARKESEGDV